MVFQKEQVLNGFMQNGTITGPAANVMVPDTTAQVLGV